MLSGGAGTRLRPITFSMAKQLVPVGNKPILFYGLEDIASAGIKEVGIVISPETGDEIRRAVGDGTQFGLTEVEYIVQDRPAGLAHALKTALPWVDGDDILMYLGDNLLKPGVAKIVADFEQNRPNCQILLTPVPNPGEFGVAEVDEHGRVVRLVEKPKEPPSDLALVGVYLFDSGIADALEAIVPSARGELEITDAIQWLVENGRDVRHSVVRGWWKDTGRKEDLLHANELLLTNLTDDIRGELVGSTMRGAVQVAERSRLIDCVVTGPAVIGAGVNLTRVTVGPNTSIGDLCRLSDAAVEDSIIMEGAEVHGWRIRNSLLGRDSRLHGTAPAGFVEMTLGEKSEIFGE